MNSFSDRLGGYVAELHAAVARAGILPVVLLLPGWFVFPFTVQSLLHPLDVVKLDHLLHGLPMPHTATGRQLAVALTEAAIVLALFGLWQLIATVSFYRKAQVIGRRAATPMLWPVAACLVGGVGNLCWFIGLSSSTSDFSGYITGLSAACVSVLIEMLCEQAGRDFVIGTPRGFHPPI